MSNKYDHIIETEEDLIRWKHHRETINAQPLKLLGKVSDLDVFEEKLKLLPEEKHEIARCIFMYAGIKEFLKYVRKNK